MAFTIAIVVSICVLIWWFAGDHSFDILGRYINIAGFILIVVGFAALFDFSGAILRKNIKTDVEGNRKVVERRRQFRDAQPRDLPLVMFFSGSGLLCLFIGVLIIIGLE